jgi:hypothetical protein
MTDQSTDITAGEDGENGTLLAHLRSAHHENEELRLINQELKREIQGSNDTLRQLAALLRAQHEELRNEYGRLQAEHLGLRDEFRTQQTVWRDELSSPRFLLRKFWPALRARLTQKLGHIRQAQENL